MSMKLQVRFSVESSESETEDFSGQEKFPKLNFEIYTQRSVPNFRAVHEPTSKPISFPSKEIENYKIGQIESISDILEGFEPTLDPVITNTSLEIDKYNVQKVKFVDNSEEEGTAIHEPTVKQILFPCQQFENYKLGQINHISDIHEGFEPKLDPVVITSSPEVDKYKVHKVQSVDFFEEEKKANDLQKLAAFQKLRTLFKNKAEYNIEVKPKIINEVIVNEKSSITQFEIERQHDIIKHCVPDNNENLANESNKINETLETENTIESTVTFNPEEIHIDKQIDNKEKFLEENKLVTFQKLKSLFKSKTEFNFEFKPKGIDETLTNEKTTVFVPDIYNQHKVTELRSLTKKKAEYHIEIKPKVVDETITSETNSITVPEIEKQHNAIEHNTSDTFDCSNKETVKINETVAIDTTESIVNFDSEKAFPEKQIFIEEKYFEKNFSQNDNVVHITFDSNLDKKEEELKTVSISEDTVEFPLQNFEKYQVKETNELLEPIISNETFVSKEKNLEKIKTHKVKQVEAKKEELIPLNDITESNIEFPSCKLETVKCNSNLEPYEPKIEQTKSPIYKEFEQYKIYYNKTTKYITPIKQELHGSLPTKLRHSFSEADPSSPNSVNSKKKKSFKFKPTKILSNLRIGTTNSSSKRTFVSRSQSVDNIPYSTNSDISKSQNTLDNRDPKLNTIEEFVNPFDSFEKSPEGPPEVPLRVNKKVSKERPHSEPIPLSVPLLQSKSKVGYNRRLLKQINKEKSAKENSKKGSFINHVGLKIFLPSTQLVWLEFDLI